MKSNNDEGNIGIITEERIKGMKNKNITREQKIKERMLYEKQQALN